MKNEQNEALPPLVSGTADEVVKNVPAGHSSAPIPAVLTADSFKALRITHHRATATLCQFIIPQLIQCVNHGNKQVHSKRCRLLHPSKQG